MRKTVWEHCPHCDSDVELKAIREKQECPECGAKIKPCALCDADNVRCSECYLE